MIKKDRWQDGYIGHYVYDKQAKVVRQITEVTAKRPSQTSVWSYTFMRDNGRDYFNNVRFASPQALLRPTPKEAIEAFLVAWSKDIASDAAYMRGLQKAHEDTQQHKLSQLDEAEKLLKAMGDN